MQKIAFLADETQEAQRALDVLSRSYGSVSTAKADVIVALGGDGFMLSTLHNTQSKPLPVYGMNRGTVGFLMNEFSEENLYDRLKSAEAADISPLRMYAICDDGSKVDALAINEVSLLRAGPQAAKLKITIDGKVRMEELVCDGALVSTPAGSTAYNYSSHGPILPIQSDVLAMTAISAYRPRRWRGALLPKTAHVKFDVLQPDKRPVMADADSRFSTKVLSVEISSDKKISHRILFDPDHGLEERLIREQFV
ncbi:MAG: NAD kinase [Nitrospinaceae bacterium]|jgi:NAD+ kinase|nr:NAD kinase [Nitrospinaceae bacterium]